MPSMTPINTYQPELASIQADMAAAICDKTATIARASRTTNAQGGATATFAPVTQPSGLTTVAAGMAQPTASQLANYDFLVGSKSAWQLHFPVGTNVLEEDRVTIEGEVLTVNKVLTPRSYAALLTVLASEVK